MQKPIFPPDRTLPAEVDWAAALPELPEPEFAGATFVFIKDGRARVHSEAHVGELAARVLAGKRARAGAWDVLLIKTRRMDRPEACTVEADPLERRPSMVFRASDGFPHFAMSIPQIGA